ANGERAQMPRVIGGRYGISSKDFTPAMVKTVFDELAKPQPKNSFSIGINDSHKSGAQTVSHLRFGPEPIHAPYLIASASFVACHQFSFIEKVDVLRLAAPGAVFLLNSPYGPDDIWDHLPRAVQ